MPKFLSESGTALPFDQITVDHTDATMALPSGEEFADIAARLINDGLTFLDAEIQYSPSSGVLLLGEQGNDWRGFELEETTASGVAVVSIEGRNIFLAQSGTTALSGNYDYGKARMWIPRENNITVTPTFVGEIRYIQSSGTMVIWGGSEWARYPLTSQFGTGISPLDSAISDQLELWLDAGAGITKGGDVSGVNTWDDLSGNGHQFGIQAGRPHMVDEGGLSGVYFDGNDILKDENAGVDWDGTDQPVTILVAYKPTESFVDGTHSIFMQWNTSSSNPGITCSLSSVNRYNFFKRDDGGSQISVTVGEPGGVGVKEVMTFWHNGTQSSVFASGQAQSIAISGMDLANMLAQRVSVGGLSRPGFGDTNFCEGIYYGVAVFSSGLSSDHRRDVERNFAIRYGAAVQNPFDVNQV